MYIYIYIYIYTYLYIHIYIYLFSSFKRHDPCWLPPEDAAPPPCVGPHSPRQRSSPLTNPLIPRDEWNGLWLALW